MHQEVLRKCKTWFAFLTGIYYFLTFFWKRSKNNRKSVIILVYYCGIVFRCSLFLCISIVFINKYSKTNSHFSRFFFIRSIFIASQLLLPVFKMGIYNFNFIKAKLLLDYICLYNFSQSNQQFRKYIFITIQGLLICN